MRILREYVFSISSHPTSLQFLKKFCSSSTFDNPISIERNSLGNYVMKSVYRKRILLRSAARQDYFIKGHLNRTIFNVTSRNHIFYISFAFECSRGSECDSSPIINLARPQPFIQTKRAKPEMNGHDDTGSFKDF